MKKVIRIGTRDSELAVWQATQVKTLLAKYGCEAKLIPVKSEGDVDLVTPLYAMGVQGVFTRALDVALLNDQIDIAVHSMKDVPTQLPENIVQAAVLPRGSVHDILVYNGEPTFLNQQQPAIIATGSVRRKAQWLNRYPHHTITDLRGNVNTRLKKLQQSRWQGAVFAKAGLERINLLPANSLELDWMLPAPAQGAIVVTCRNNDIYSREACNSLNDINTATCVSAERDFLRTLMGGCSTPISAFAKVEEDQFYFKGNIVSTDGKEKKEISKVVNIAEAKNVGIIAAKEILENGGRAILQSIKAAEKI